MASLNLTWSAPNNCWVKSLGYWINPKNSRRTPRFFRFAQPNTPEGRRAAENELVPLLAQWQAIRAAAKQEGVEPVWYRDLKLTEAPKINPFAPAATKAKQVAAVKAVRANEVANPMKTLEAASIEQARTQFVAWIKSTGVKPTTLEALEAAFRQSFKGFDVSQKMVGFDCRTIIDSIIVKVGTGKIAVKTASNQFNAIKRLCEWYSTKVEAYRLPNDWRNLFRTSRLKSPRKATEVLTEDETDFVIFSNEQLKKMIGAAFDDRQKLIVLLALNAAMLFTDIADLRSANIHLEEPKPYLLYRRTKESHRDPITQKVWLWKETARLLGLLMKKGEQFAVLGQQGQPLTAKAVAECWKGLRDKMLVAMPERAKNVRFKDLRKTGATVITNLSGLELGQLYLGHKVAGVDGRYIKIAKDRLHEPLKQWEKQLF